MYIGGPGALGGGDVAVAVAGFIPCLQARRVEGRDGLMHTAWWQILADKWLGTTICVRVRAGSVRVRACRWCAGRTGRAGEATSSCSKHSSI